MFFNHGVATPSGDAWNSVGVAWNVFFHLTEKKVSGVGRNLWRQNKVTGQKKVKNHSLRTNSEGCFYLRAVTASFQVQE